MLSKPYFTGLLGISLKSCFVSYQLIKTYIFKKWEYDGVQITALSTTLPHIEPFVFFPVFVAK